MAEPQRAIVPLSEAGPTVPGLVGDRGITVRNIDELARLATMAFKSGLCGRSFANVEAVGVAIATGLELGLSPMQSLQCVVVINGRPGLNGTAAKALVEASGLLQDFAEWYEVGGKTFDDPGGNFQDTTAACCRVQRVGRSPRTTRFTVAQAKRAGLWGKAGPWTQYPERMLRWRCVGFALNDAFPDVLKGFKTAEELMDFPPAKGKPAAVEVGLPPAAEAATDEAPAEVVDDAELCPMDLLFKADTLIRTKSKGKAWAPALEHFGIAVPDQFEEPKNEDDLLQLGGWLRRADAERVVAILEGKK